MRDSKTVSSSSSASQQPLKPSSANSTTPLSSFFAGIAGGSASTILLYPLDLIKVRMQVDESRRESSNSRGGSIMSGGGNTARSTNATTSKPNAQVDKQPRTICTTVRGVIRHEGYLGLYRGLTPAIIGSAASWGGFFILYEEIKGQMLLRKKQVHFESTKNYGSSRQLSTSTTDDNGYDLSKDMHVDEEIDINTNASHQEQDMELGPIDHFSASCLAGACLVALTNPIWLIKTRLQLQNSQLLEHQLSQQQQAGKQQQQKVKPAYRGLLHTAKTIIHEEGILALYKGSIPALMLVSHGGIQFVTYEFMKGHFTNFFAASSSSSAAATNDNGKKDEESKWKKSSGRNKGTIRERLRDSLGYLVMGATSKL